MSGFALKRRYKLSSSEQQPPAEVPTKDDASTTRVAGVDSFICLALELDVLLFSEPITSYVYSSRAGDGGSFSVSQFGLQYDDLAISELDTHQDGKPRYGASLSRHDKIVVKHVDPSKAAGATHAAQDIDVLGPLALEMRVLAHPPLRDHKNIVSLIGVAWEPQLDFNNRCWPTLVLEHAHCGNLGDFFSLPAIQFSWDLKVHLSVGIIDGLSALHQSRVAHGDLKPENVLVTTDGDGNFVAMLSDFGFSTIEMDCIGPTALPGYTPDWVAPDARRGPLEWDMTPLLDIYAFGLVFAYIMLSGTHPFSTNAGQLSVGEINQLQEDDEVSSFVLESLSRLGWSTAQWQKISGVLETTLASSPMERCQVVTTIKGMLGFSCNDDATSRAASTSSCGSNMGDLETESDSSGTAGNGPVPAAFFDAGEISEGIFDASGDTWKLVILPQAAQQEICQCLQRKAERLLAPLDAGQAYHDRLESCDAAYALSIAMSAGLGGSYDWQSIVRWLEVAATGGSLQAQADLPRVLAALGRESSHGASRHNFVSWLSRAVDGGQDRFVQDSLEELDRDEYVRAVGNLAQRRRIGWNAVPGIWGDHFPDAMVSFWNQYASYHIQGAGAGAGAASTESNRLSLFDVATQGLADIPSLVEFVQYKLSAPPTVYKGGLSLLHLSANLGITALVEVVLASPGFHVDMPDGDGRTALLFSSLAGNSEMANHLLDQGANAAVAHDEDGNTCLHYIGSFERNAIPDLVRRLRESGADVDAQNAKLETPLHTTLKVPDSSSTSFCAAAALLDNGADPSIADKDGDLPLVWPVKYLQPHTLELLLSRMELSPGESATLLALLYEDFLGTPELDRMVYGGVQYQPRLRKMLCLLLTKASCVEFKNLKDGSGESAFFGAVYQGAIRLAATMVQEIPWLHVDEVDSDGRTVLRYAIRHRQKKVVEALASLKASFLFVDGSGENAFHVAAEYYPDILPYLFTKVPDSSVGAMLNSAMADGSTPFDKAAMRGHMAAARLLVSRGADFAEYRLKTSGDAQASTLGAVLGLPTASKDQVSFLVELGVSPMTATDGSNVFHSISSLDFTGPAITDLLSFELDSKMAIFDLLLAKYPDKVHQTNAKGQTALHLASWAVRSDVVTRLCALGLDPKSPDSSGNTPIELAHRRRESGILDTKDVLARVRISRELDNMVDVLRRYS